MDGQLMPEESKPTLQEIAHMPFSQSRDAIRKFYDPHFGMGAGEGENAYLVTVEFTSIEYNEEDYTIYADSQKEASAKAIDVWEEEYPGADHRLVDAHVSLQY